MRTWASVSSTKLVLVLLRPFSIFCVVNEQELWESLLGHEEAVPMHSECQLPSSVPVKQAISEANTNMRKCTRQDTHVPTKNVYGALSIYILARRSTCFIRNSIDSRG